MKRDPRSSAQKRTSQGNMAKNKKTSRSREPKDRFPAAAGNLQKKVFRPHSLEKETQTLDDKRPIADGPENIIYCYSQRLTKIMHLSD